MADMGNNGRRKGEPKHVRIYRWMFDCPAYRSLNVYERCLLVELGRRYNGTNNGEISMSVREAANRLGCSINPAAKAFRGLEGRGFIRTHVKGAFNVKQRHATTWILTEYEYAGKKPTKDFMKWSTEKQNPVSPRNTVSITS
ncbi:MAG: hypothetical protein O7B98_10970 [Alphaproteobacteria bacterium]|nr:hypothetical protein [Alphaproteobacteria bacterium]